MMQREYFIESMNWNIAGQVIWPVLSVCEGKHAFKQDFERAWTPLVFESEFDALNFARKFYNSKSPDVEPRQFVLSEDYSKILVIGPDQAHEVARITIGDIES